MSSALTVEIQSDDRENSIERERKKKKEEKLFVQYLARRVEPRVGDAIENLVRGWRRKNEEMRRDEGGKNKVQTGNVFPMEERLEVILWRRK